MDFLEIAENVSHKIWSYNQDSSGWNLAKGSRNVTVCWKPSTEFGGNLYRGEGIIEDIPEKIIPFMYLPEYRMKWDKALKSYSILERLDEDTVICHTVTHSYGMGLISSRDFVDLVKIKKYEGGIITTNSRSIDYQACLPSPSCVRGYNNPCGYVCSSLPQSPGHSRLTIFIQPDLGGMLPRSLVESALPNNIINLINDAQAGLKSAGY
ncbi:stAR-related lipid transfer protein 6-like isoform X2 [Erpetoichthys calabaricus]|uniref:StAR related lipid transfer domain containing 6 n=1 Tax=Erpetoichthys calabaricus TaxID=27687 RepID=A0A8C4RQJ1_ERPCA|nr:stAR-related lipid transfer protein 6-like isoform X2 [Erpetoichthys calabaricus]